MLRSDYCSLAEHTDRELQDLGECPFDQVLYCRPSVQLQSSAICWDCCLLLPIICYQFEVAMVRLGCTFSKADQGQTILLLLRTKRLACCSMIRRLMVKECTCMI